MGEKKLSDIEIILEQKKLLNQFLKVTESTDLANHNEVEKIVLEISNLYETALGQKESPDLIDSLLKTKTEIGRYRLGMEIQARRGTGLWGNFATGIKCIFFGLIGAAATINLMADPKDQPFIDVSAVFCSAYAIFRILRARLNSKK